MVPSTWTTNWQTKNSISYGTTHHVTGCVKPTKVDKLFTLWYIDTPQERQILSAEQERTKQLTDPRQLLYGHV
jgi:hypothetical protein